MSSIYKQVSTNDVQQQQQPHSCTDPILSSTTTIDSENEIEMNGMSLVSSSSSTTTTKWEYVNVTAPTNLPSGYELIVDVMDSGSFWTVQVPDGGVTMNETFRAKVLHKTEVAKAEFITDPNHHHHPSTTKTPTPTTTSFDIPVGRWRDGIFDCCIIPFHPICFLTYCLPWIALGQVMTRMHVCMCRRRCCHPSCQPFHTMLTLTILNGIYQVVFSGLAQTVFTTLTLWFMLSSAGGNSAMYNPSAFTPSSSSFGGSEFNDDAFLAKLMNSTDDNAFNSLMMGDDTGIKQNATNNTLGTTLLSLSLTQYIVMIGLYIFIVVVHTKTRNQIRRVYSIGTNMSTFGDCCCACWCGMCSICQIARHTANYHTTHRSRCCTPNGLDEEWGDYDFLAVEHHHPNLSVMPTHRSVGPMMV